MLSHRLKIHIISPIERIWEIASKIDNLLLEYFNRMDKEVVKVHHQLNLKCVVITTEDNYTKLLKVADKPSIYKAFTKINYNDNSEHSIVKSAWEKYKAFRKKEELKRLMKCWML